MAENVISSEKPSSSSPLDPPSRIVCHVCQKQFSQYTCPRCNSRYCSLHCYKSHSLRCTESFMRENVVGELRNLQPNDETKGKMLDILKRFHSEEEEEGEEPEYMDEEDSTLSEETIQKILSGGQINFDDLSAQEKIRFRRAIASGELSKTIEPWDPWWSSPSAGSISLGRDGTQLVQPITDGHVDEDERSEIPPGPTSPLPQLSSLTSADPSPLLPFHLVDILYSYCFTLRLYNGDWRSDPIGSASVLLTVSSVLGQGAEPETASEALSRCLEQACSPGYRHLAGPRFGSGIFDDVAGLLALGGNAVLRALSDLRCLVGEAERELRSEKPRRGGDGRKLKLAERKVFFVMCWVRERPGEAWSTLAAVVRAEKCLVSGRDGGPEERGGNRSKVLIEEVE